jgi:uracil-DNA glycosylase
MNQSGSDTTNGVKPPHIEPGWGKVLNSEFQSIEFQSLKNFLIEERKRFEVYPPGADILTAFNATPFNSVKAVILGQDPYHGPGQAHGLSFSVPKGVPIPPSLRNIFKELKQDVGMNTPEHGCLEKWAEQGVLLLNATLTVRANQAGSHQKKGWEQFTDAAIKALSTERSGIVFLLWGRFAQVKCELIDSNKHYILQAPHPSPLSASRGFFGCRHFSETNRILAAQGKKTIAWEVT